MDAPRFDALTRAMATGTRRTLLGLLLMLPGVGNLVTLLDVEEAAARKNRRKGRKKPHKRARRRRQKRKRRKNTKNTCTRKPRARICANRCGIVKNRKTCQKKVNCGPCCPNLLPTDDLQAAIDATPAGGTLTLCAGTWDLTSTVTITGNLTLVGAGAGQTILDGGEAARVVQIVAGAAVILQNLTVTRGRATGGDAGGGIANSGDLTLRGVTVTGNASTEHGGGVYSSLVGALTVEAGTDVALNTAGGVGGGIYNLGVAMTLTNSTVRDNTAGGDGGGIFNQGDESTLTNCAVHDNTSGDDGGGIYNLTAMSITNCTVRDNEAGTGGGIVNAGGTMTLDGDSHVCENRVNGEPSNCIGFTPPAGVCVETCPP